MCKCCEEENKQELTEEEIDNIIVEKYNNKSDKAKVFIKKALRVQGDKYDYSKVNYKTCKDRVIIICPKHGEFEQTPDSHTNGKSGCTKCVNERTGERCRYTKEDFIRMSIEKYGNRYDYSKVDYVDYYTPVIIICPVHGEVEVSPLNHLYKSKYGCPKCRYVESGLKQRSTTEEFIEKARKVHGDKYSYDKVNYIKSDEKVIITCPIHGDFEQTPGNHLTGYECDKCGNDKISEHSRKTTEQFIKEAREIHGDKYNYDKVNYIDINTKVIITCPKHGDFEQTPHDHLRGSGCSDCKTSFGELSTKLFLESSDILFEQHKYIQLDITIYPDFVLTDSRVWIEYNGKQHYEYVDIFHKFNNSRSRSFISQLKRDAEERKYCRENNITLIEIPYIFNTREKVFDFLDKVLIQHIDPNTLVDYSKLYKLENTGLSLEDLYLSS